MSRDDHALALRPRWRLEKIGAALVAVAPALWLAGLAYDGDLGVRAVHQAVRESGDWAIRLFWLTLAVSPARRILAAPRLLAARRILGLGAFGLTVLHIALYALDLQFDWGRIGVEIVVRLYLMIGAVATLGLAALAVTSSDAAILRLGGGRWKRLHGLVYAIAALAAVHFLLRSRTDTFEPMLMIGLLAWLVGYRLLQRLTGDVGVPLLFALALAAATLTALAEVSWHAAATGVDPWKILAAHLDVGYGLRPAWWVLIAGVAAALAGWRWRLVPQRPSMRIASSSAAAGSTHRQSAS
jgi:methionine sulfoxide reductase heme-binding subunit